MNDIERRLALALMGPEREPDRTALEPTERLFQACVAEGRAAEFGVAAVSALDGDLGAVCVLVRMFANHPGMPGAEGWLDRFVADPERFPEVPPMLPGEVGHTVRTSALKAGLTFETPPRPAIVQLARVHVLEPGGAYGLVYVLWRADRPWVESHVGEILAANPDAAAQVFGQLIAYGATPDAAMDTVLAGARAVRASEFSYGLRQLPEEVQARLRTRLAAHPVLAGEVGAP